MIRTLVADDHPVVRAGLKQILVSASDILVVGESADGMNLLAQIRETRCDVVLLDITLPGRNGLEILREVKREYPRLAVLILSIHPEDQYALRALKAGAAGYLTKESAPDQLVEAVRKVARGGKYLSPAVAELLADDLETDSDKPLHETLSDREYQVLCLIAAGRKAKDIAQTLALSVKTVSTYRARILAKMRIETNVGLTHYALRHGLIE